MGGNRKGVYLLHKIRFPLLSVRRTGISPTQNRLRLCCDVLLILTPFCWRVGQFRLWHLHSTIRFFAADGRGLYPTFPSFAVRCFTWWLARRCYPYYQFRRTIADNNLSEPHPPQRIRYLYWVVRFIRAIRLLDGQLHSLEWTHLFFTTTIDNIFNQRTVV